MRFAAEQLHSRGVPAERIRVSLERNMKCGIGLCGHCQLGPLLLCRDGPVVDYGQAAALLSVTGVVMDVPTLAVWKFASCDGCQLTLLDCEDELLPLAGRVRIAHFLEASSAVVPGPYDVSLVEGSITTPEDGAADPEIREQSRVLVTIGACATAGGIQALRNFADVEEFTSVVYAQPEYIDTLATSTPVADHVPVDYELRGCPIDRGQLLEVLAAFLVGPQAATCPTTACAPSASAAASPVSWWPRASPASVRSPTPAAARSARPTAAAATAASARSAPPNIAALIPRLHAATACPATTCDRVFPTFNVAAPEFAAQGATDEPSKR